jgi:hypothetical protein
LIHNLKEHTMSSFAELLKAKKQALGARNKAKTAKIPDGRSRWRLLPSWRGKGHDVFWHDFGQHFVKNAAGDMQAVYMCVDKTFGRPCDVCDAVSHGIKHATDDATMKVVTDARANGRVLVNAIHLDGPKPTEVQILELPPTAFAMIIDIAGEWVEAGVNILDVGTDGKDLVIERTGSGKLTKYVVQPGAKTTAIDASALTRLINLDDYVAQESSEQQMRALNAIRQVAGALPAPVASTALAGPSSGMPAGSVIVDDAYEVATPPPRRAAAPVEDAVASAPKPAAKAAPKAAVAAAPAESTGDDDLDAMLADLDAA